MQLTVYYFDDETALKVNNELVPFKTGADIRNLMQRAYEAGSNGESFVCDNQFKDPHA